MSKNNLTIAIIPARMASSRFPGKPMEKIQGMPLIEHVYKRTTLVKNIDSVIVATCDEEIYKHITNIGGIAVMTSEMHKTASDRAAEALQIIEETENISYQIVALIQGDEPIFDPEDVENAINAIDKKKNENIVNLMNSSNSKKEYEDFNNVKVVTDNNDYAMYFSREAIPSQWKAGGNYNFNIQTGLIIFRSGFLKRFLKMKETNLERIESCDMLRVLENGESIKMLSTNSYSFGVDTKNDLVTVNDLMAEDKFFKMYN
tara:strand:- start:1609 stop:2388 length:780 start_codon:yes stop_codon:yes gene_type:complete